MAEVNSISLTLSEKEKVRDGESMISRTVQTGYDLARKMATLRKRNEEIISCPTILVVHDGDPSTEMCEINPVQDSVDSPNQSQLGRFLMRRAQKCGTASDKQKSNSEKNVEIRKNDLDYQCSVVGQTLARIAYKTTVRDYQFWATKTFSKMTNTLQYRSDLHSEKQLSEKL